jgi:hypothetical protein
VKFGLFLKKPRLLMASSVIYNVLSTKAHCPQVPLKKEKKASSSRKEGTKGEKSYSPTRCLSSACKGILAFFCL